MTEPQNTEISRLGIIGNLVFTGFILAVIAMASHALHREQQLAPREQQLLQRQR